MFNLDINVDRQLFETWTKAGGVSLGIHVTGVTYGAKTIQSTTTSPRMGRRGPGRPSKAELAARVTENKT